MRERGEVENGRAAESGGAGTWGRTRPSLPVSIPNQRPLPVGRREAGVALGLQGLGGGEGGQRRRRRGSIGALFSRLLLCSFCRGALGRGIGWGWIGQPRLVGGRHRGCVGWPHRRERAKQKRHANARLARRDVLLVTPAISMTPARPLCAAVRRAVAPSGARPVTHPPHLPRRYPSSSPIAATSSPGTPIITPADRAHMRRALDLARRGLGRTHPNPAVGCVVLDAGGEVRMGGAGDGARAGLSFNLPFSIHLSSLLSLHTPKVVGEGYHPKAGEPHAEVFALRAAGE
jgi:hypothetical protein